ncbi:hypothetical protein L0F63_005736 [Massospora cicadina]|nr:hypothetical protein L0F63_005736 [Massospora cicadina]
MLLPPTHYSAVASVQNKFTPGKCGVCLAVSFNGKTKTVRIVDLFEEGQAKVQLDANTFAELGLEEGVSMVTYDEVICPENKPRYKNVEGSNQHWAQFVIYDHPTEIREVYGILANDHHVLLERTKHNTFEYPKQDGVVVSPLMVRIVDIYNNDKVDEIRSTCTKTEFGGLTPSTSETITSTATVTISTPVLLKPEPKLADSQVQFELDSSVLLKQELYDRNGHGEASGKKVKKVGYRKEIANEGTSYAGKKICVPVGTLN